MRNFEVLIKNREILKKIDLLAKEIDNRYKKEPIVLICVLKGAIVFYGELLKRLKNKNIELDFIQVKSYEGTTSSGEVKLINEFGLNVKDKNVVIVEDIVDTGYTANFLFNYFKNKNPKSILMCALLQKPEKLKVKLEMPLLTGFEIENKFIIGFGLDLDEKYRNVKDILVFKRN